MVGRYSGSSFVTSNGLEPFNHLFYKFNCVPAITYGIAVQAVNASSPATRGSRLQHFERRGHTCECGAVLTTGTGISYGWQPAPACPTFTPRFYR
jgi:hypothetical protein